MTEKKKKNVDATARITMVRTRRQAALIGIQNHVFAKVPQELLCMIIDDLDLNSLKKLRLVNRNLAAWCLVPSFLARCTQPRTNLSVPYIRFLAKAATHEVFGPLTKSITIHASSFAKRDFDDNDDKLVEELTTTLRALGTIEDLDISGATPQEGMYADGASVRPQHAVTEKLRKRRKDQSYPERASDGFVIVMRAIARSGVLVRNLTVMEPTANRRCCLQTIDLARALALMKKEGSDFAAAAAAVKTLSLNVCTRLNASGYPRLEGRRKGFHVFRMDHHKSQARAPSNFTGLAGLLDPMENLRELKISFHNELVEGPHDTAPPVDWYSEMFRLVSERVRLPRLAKVNLLMVPTTETGLLNFLTANPGLRDVTLSWMRLVRGGWRPVFDHLAGMPGLKKLCLVAPSDLKGCHNLLPADGSVSARQDAEFRMVRGWKLLTSTATDYIYRREFGEEEIREGLLFEEEITRYPVKYFEMFKAMDHHRWYELCD